MAAELTCIVVALAREAMFFRRWLGRPRAVPAAPCPAWAAPGPGGDVLLIHSGMGGEAARRALDWALARFAPTRVLSAGFCGGLAEDLPVGAVVQPEEVLTEDGGHWRCPGRGGRLLSVSRPVGTPAQRRALRRLYGAVAVDLESAAVARACHEAGVSCRCVRAVSDDAQRGLSSQVGEAIQGDRVQVGKIALAVLRRPRLAGELWQLAKQSRLAAWNLSATLQQLLEMPGGTG
jgi:adenosylhomocysteine nucleosidase